jgi:transposase
MGYGSDLRDAQWKVLAPLLTSKRKDLRGPKVKGGLRKRINAIFYVTKTGSQWRQLPKEFGPWLTVYSTFYRLQQRGIWEEILVELHGRFRVQAGKTKEPTVAIIDSQSAKTALNGGNAGSMRARRSKAASDT